MFVDALLYALLAQRPRPPRPETPFPPPPMAVPVAPSATTVECEEYVGLLIVGPGVVLYNAFLATIFIAVLAVIHFSLKAAQECFRHPATYAWFWRCFGVASAPRGKPDGETGVQEASEVIILTEGTCLERVKRCVLPREDETDTDLPLYMVVKVEGQAFANFLVLSALEAVLSLTGVANASLAGDFEYANDQTGLVGRVSWGLVLGNIALLVTFVIWFRRLRGHRGYLCMFNSAGQ